MKLNTIIKGKINSISGGSAFLISDEIEEDLYISRANINKSLHNDLVNVRIVDDKYTGKYEGVVIDIIERFKTEFVGIIDIQGNHAFVRPDSKKINIDFYMKEGSFKGIKNGEKVIVKMCKWKDYRNSPNGRIIKRLGMSGENDTEIKSIMYEYDIKNGFDNKVIDEVVNIDVEISIDEIKKRRDFRNTITISIDPQGCKDRDDSLSYHELRNGNIEVGIHIADVSHYVKIDSEIDKEAYKRGNSTYLVDRVIPMLPEKLSNNICSLDEGSDKLTFSFIFTFDKNYKIVKRWFGKGIVNLNVAMSYEKAQEMIDNNYDNNICKSIIKLNEISKKLRDNRDIIEFDRQEISFILDENSKPTVVHIKKSLQTNKLIEEFMLLTNREVGEFIFNKNKPNIYRSHNSPDIEKVQELSNFVKEFGYKIDVNSKNIKRELNNLLTDIRHTNEENLISTLVVRTMSKAECTSNKIHSHYGLSMEHYSWMTSPIRRYADLVSHRILCDVIGNGGYNN